MHRSDTRTTGPGAEPVSALARALAAGHLDSSHRLPTDCLPEDIFSELMDVVEHERVLGAMAEAVVDGMLPLTDGQLGTFTDRHQLWCRHALDVEALLLRFAACCMDAGIEFRVLKGVALAHLVHDNPSFRVFGDLDVLVPGDRFDDAVELACSELGGTRSLPELRAGFNHEFGKDALVRVGHIELDLHRTFVSGPFGLTVDLDRLFAASMPFRVGGRELHALDRIPLLLHACYNAALGDFPPKLGPMRDLALIASGMGDATTEVRDLAEHWKATAVVRRAAELTVDRLALRRGHPLHTLTAIPVKRREDWLLQSYVGHSRSYRRPLASLAVIPGVGARLRYARALVSPSAEYLRSRGWTERSHLRRARDRLFRRG